MAGKLYTPVEPPTVRGLALRFGAVVAVLMVLVLVVHVEGGLVDMHTGERPNLLGCLYFVLVTVTTVGYGDIVPVGTMSRLTDAFLLTPVRFLVIFTFVGTAYQVIIQRFREEYRMKRAVEKLQDHVLVCGFGNTGRVAAQELLLQGTPADQIVVLDTNELVLADAAEMGLLAIQGDPSREHVLQSVAIDRAAYVLICPGRDDTAVLIALTAQTLNPNARLIAMCLEEENVKVLQRVGADTIISRAAAGGNLMAAATRRAHLVETMQDMLTVGGALKLDERPVTHHEVGKHPGDIPGVAVLRIYRDGRHHNVSDLPRLRKGDTIVFVTAGEQEPA
ncbi:MAG: potassium transporter TrkA [Nitrospiraceae bacterium]|nr:potassium transporter TrkA [Nitrospiraceae bacterium]